MIVFGLYMLCAFIFMSLAIKVWAL